MERLNFSAFDKKIYINGTSEDLYKAWATTAGLCSWFLREATFTGAAGQQRQVGELVSPGDRYTWKWHNWDEAESGLVTVADGHSQLEFEFAGSSKVRVLLEQGSEKNILVHLRQYDIPTDDKSKLQIYTGCSNGWTFWLANLKAWTEHGILLNETGVDLREDPMAGFVFVNI